MTIFLNEKIHNALLGGKLQHLRRLESERNRSRHLTPFDVNRVLEGNACKQLYPIHLAAQNTTEHAVDIVNYLLHKGADLTVVDCYGHTALHMAAAFGITPVLRMLLSRGAQYSALTIDGENCLHLAAYHGQLENVRFLLQRRCAYPLDIDVLDGEGGCALHWAAYKGHADIIKLLEEHNANLNMTNNNGQTAAHIAYEQENWEALLTLARLGANINTFTNTGENMLLDAVETNNEDGVYTLLAAGIDTELREVKPNGDERPTHVTALWLAASLGHAKIVEMLCECYADVNACNQEHATPLWAAAAHGHLKCVRALLDAGACKDAADVNGVTPVMMACQQGHESVVMCLLDANVDVQARNADGDTVLLVAVKFARVSLVRALLDAGADATVTDANDNLPSYYASVQGSVEAMAMLQSARCAADDVRRVEEAAEVGADADDDELAMLDTAPIDMAVIVEDSKSSTLICRKRVRSQIENDGEGVDRQQLKQKSPLPGTLDTHDEAAVAPPPHKRTRREITSVENSTSQEMLQDKEKLSAPCDSTIKGNVPVDRDGSLLARARGAVRRLMRNPFKW